MANNITELLKEATKDLLTPETLSAIEEAVNTKADEKAKLQVEAALVAQDEKHATMLTGLMERMDADHTSKLRRLMERVDESYARKLLEVKGLYDNKISSLNNQLTKSAKNLTESLNSKIHVFLENKLNKIAPDLKLTAAVENIRAVKILEQVRNLVGVTESDISTEIKEAIVDGKHQIDESTRRLNEVINENVKLKNQIANKEAELLIESKTLKLPAKKREHIKKVLEGKSVKFINENLSYISDVFDHEEVIESSKARESARKVGTTVDVGHVINESKSLPKVDNRMSTYLQGLK